MQFKFINPISKEIDDFNSVLKERNERAGIIIAKQINPFPNSVKYEKKTLLNISEFRAFRNHISIAGTDLTNRASAKKIKLNNE